jgi:hypothetical protein
MGAWRTSSAMGSAMVLRNLARQGSATSFSQTRLAHRRYSTSTTGKRIFNRQPLTHSNPQDEVHVRSPRMRLCTRRSLRNTAPNLRTAHHQNCPPACSATIRDMGELWLTLGTATPRNCSRSPRGSRSPSRPGMSSSRVSGLVRTWRGHSWLTFRRSPRKAHVIRRR